MRACVCEQAAKDLIKTFNSFTQKENITDKRYQISSNYPQD